MFSIIKMKTDKQKRLDKKRIIQKKRYSIIKKRMKGKCK